MENKYIKIIYTAIFASATFILCGCGSTNAAYVEAGGPRSVISTDKINIADWNAASAALVNDMLSSNVLERYKQPAKMKVSRIMNRTSRAIDTDLLTKQVCIALNNSGKVSAVSSDKMTSELAEYEAMKNDTQVSMPTLTLTGKIIEDRDDNSDVREVTYVFMLELNDRTGVSVWLGQKQIAKQAVKDLFGD